jgi:hypothetical protein
MSLSTTDTRNRGKAIAPRTLRHLSLGIAGVAFCAGTAGALPQAPAPAKSASSARARVHRETTSVPGDIVLRGVTVSRSNQAIIVNLKCDGPVRVTATRVPAPERIVIDLQGARYAGRALRLPVSGGEVLAVRVSQYHSKPAVTRVVLDVARTFPFEIVSFQSGFAIQVNTGLETAPAPVEEPAAAVAPVPAPPPVTPVPEIGNMQPREESIAKPVVKAAPADLAPSPATIEAAAPAAEPAVPALQLDQLQAPISRLGAPELLAAIPPAPAGNLVEDEEGPTTPHQAAKAKVPVLVNRVTVSQQSGEIDVLIEASGRLRPTARVFANPDRIVVDLANTYCERARRIPVHTAELKEVDMSLFLLNPPVTRIVLNLKRPHAYHLLGSGNSLIIRVDAHQASRTQAQPTPASKSSDPVTLLREPATR